MKKKEKKQVWEWLAESLPPGWLECAKEYGSDNLHMLTDNLLEAILNACAWAETTAGPTGNEAHQAWLDVFHAAKQGTPIPEFTGTLKEVSHE